MVNPSGYTALDLIGYTDKGTYNAVATYVKNDLVHYNGSIWRVLIDDTTGVTPTEGTNYTIFVETPTDAVAESIAPVESAITAHAYTIGQQLYYSDKLYKVIANIAIGDTLTVGTNITESNKVTSQIQTLESNVSTNTSDIQTLKNKIKRNILIFGNSYVTNGCAAKLRDTFDNSITFTGSGTGFLTYTDHTTDIFETLLRQAVDSSSVDNDSITDIIFVSAMGDTRARSERGLTAFENELTTAITSCVNIINANFANCKRISITFAETRNVASFSDYPNPYSALFDVHKTFKKICGSLGVDYLGWSGFNSLFVSADIDNDHYHPTPTGASHIGQFIKDSYYGHAEYMTKQSQASCSFGGQSGKTMTCVARLLPDSCSLNVRTATLSTGTISVSESGLFVDLSALPVPIPSPNPNMDFWVTLRDTATREEIMTTLANISANSEGVAVIKTNKSQSKNIASNIQILIEGLEAFNYII